MLCLYILGPKDHILYFNHIKAVKPNPVNIRNCQIYLFMHIKNVTEKIIFVKNVWPSISALFIYVSDDCVKKNTLSGIGGADLAHLL